MTATPADAAAAPRLDVWLARERDITRHAARTMIDAGMITVNGRPGRPGQRIGSRDAVSVVEGDAVGVRGAGGDGASRSRAGPHSERRARRVPSGGAPAGLRPRTRNPLSHAPETAAAATPLSIVYEDEHLAVVDKPAGLVVHPAPGHSSGTLADLLRERGSTWSLLGGDERPGIVHRLDRDTSGLLVVAKTEAAHRSLATQLSERTLGRTYIAIVHGGFRETSGSIDAPIARDPRNRKRMAVVDSGRHAVTDFSVVERLGDLSLLEVRLQTGRTHQIRVHMAYIRHPVLGDGLYGWVDPHLQRVALHATRLTLTHPADGSTRVFDAPLPAELVAYLDSARGRTR